MHEREAEAQLEGIGLVAHRPLQHVVRVQQVVQQPLLVETATYQPCPITISSQSEVARVNRDDFPRPVDVASPRLGKNARNGSGITQVRLSTNIYIYLFLSLSSSLFPFLYVFLFLFISLSFPLFLFLCRCLRNVYLLRTASPNLPHLPIYPITPIATLDQSSGLLFANTQLRVLSPSVSLSRSLSLSMFAFISRSLSPFLFLFLRRLPPVSFPQYKSHFSTPFSLAFYHYVLQFIFLE